MRTVMVAVLGIVLALVSVLGLSQPARALEVGDTAPDFRLPSTSGTDMGLSDFAGKKWVFLEFYALDFQPA
jgi:peroxiredoxin Q/BCP